MTLPDGPDVPSLRAGRLEGRPGELIRALGLVPHPERGYYVETYRSPLVIPPGALPQRAARAASTAIYFLVTADEPTTFLHRLRSDEVFHLYEGGPLDILLCGESEAVVKRLGRDVTAGDRPQVVIPAGTWFGTELGRGAPYALVGCTVAPGFDFADFELEPPSDLAIRFPTEASRLGRMTRPRELTRA